MSASAVSGVDSIGIVEEVNGLRGGQLLKGWAHGVCLLVLVIMMGGLLPTYIERGGFRKVKLWSI